jgi:hypothetical protein
MTTRRTDCSWELRRGDTVIAQGEGNVTVDDDEIGEDMELVIEGGQSELSQRLDTLAESAHDRLGISEPQA